MPIAPDFKTPPEGIHAGDPAPAFSLQDIDGRWINTQSDDVAGQPMVLALFRDVTEAAAEHLRAFADAKDRFAACPSLVFPIVAAEMETARMRATRADLPGALWVDPAGELLRAFAVGRGARSDGPILVVIDQNHRVVAVRDRGLPAARVAAALADLTGLVVANPRGLLGAHPPVLVLPRTLTADECAYLVDIWHRPVRLWRERGLGSAGYDHEAGDFKIRVDSYGKTDQFVVRDPEVLQFIDSRLMRRVVPQIAKAFLVTPAYREDYRIACYDSIEGGSLPRHRDSPTPDTRHRLFTVSVHLNAGDYEGGRLQFREYGDQTYQVERGTAIVWSCALLHEVTEVTKGRRFILGTHLFNDLAAMQRAAAAHQTARPQA